MDFENFNNIPQPEKQQQTTTETEVKKETHFEDLPNLEDLLKSENEVTPIVAPTIKGLKQVDEGAQTIEKTFARKEDEKKAFVKRRVKIITGVYACVFALLLGFVFVNTATLSTLGKTSTTLTQQVQAGTLYMSGQNNSSAGGEDKKIEVSVNTPRDYGDDDTDLTFFDRITILFRSLFS